VEVNPRFGTYDLETGAVVAADDPNDVLEPGESEAPPAEGEAAAEGEARRRGEARRPRAAAAE
jgi:hypothetical protein